jgi:hypothetical protein
MTTTEPTPVLSPAEARLHAALRAAQGEWRTAAELAADVRRAVGLRPNRRSVWADLHNLQRHGLAELDNQAGPGKAHLWRAADRAV